MKIRHQLPVYSPIGLRAVLDAATRGLVNGNAARDEVGDILLADFAADRCILCDSGTHALQLAIGLAQERRGEQSVVALPAFSCYDMATAGIGAGAPLTLYDIDPATLSPDLASVEAAIARGARIIVVAPLYGVPVDWDALERLANVHNVQLVEDAAQGIGALWKGRSLGTLANISTLSFGRGKGWTGGSGGAVLLRGSGAAVTLENVSTKRELSTIAGLALQELLGRPSIYGIPRSIPALHLGETKYVEPGAALALPRAAARALLRTRASSLAEAVLRRENAARMLAAISDSTILRRIRIDARATPGYLRLPLLLRGGIETLASSNATALGMAQSYPLSLAELPQLEKHLLPTAAPYDGARLLARELITIPTHSLMTRADRERVVSVLRSAR